MSENTNEATQTKDEGEARNGGNGSRQPRGSVGGRENGRDNRNGGRGNSIQSTNYNFQGLKPEISAVLGLKHEKLKIKRCMMILLKN